LLRLTGLVLGGWLLAKSAAIAARQLAAGSADTEFLRGKIATAHFYATHTLPGAAGLSRVVVEGAASVIDTDAALV
jgi:acyl-CoA dehydrogenase